MNSETGLKQDHVTAAIAKADVATKARSLANEKNDLLTGLKGNLQTQNQTAADLHR